MKPELVGKSGLKWLLVVATLATALLFWFEHLGGERPLQLREIPVSVPEGKVGSRLD
ncbi:MAG: hypothetical protein WBO17_14580 [Sphingorhabdus sp.]